MSDETLDVSATIVAKSDQLNSDDLIAGPIVVKVLNVKRCADEQPIAVEISDHKPWKPCKTMRRVLVQAWGADAKKWIGKSVVLKRDPKVKWAGQEVGGIRVQALSDIPRDMDIALTATRGKKELVTIKRLDPKASLPKPTESDLNESFNAMKELWKKRRGLHKLSVGAREWAEFITVATEGMIAATNALKPAAFTPEVIQKCVDSINFEMPEPEGEIE
jgi:hypothetical protein